MARGAAREALDVILANQALSERDLVGRWRVVHRKHLIEGAHVTLRMAMTVQTPLHRERRRLPRQRHLVHTAVAGCAANSVMDVNTVIEIDKLRQVVYARPLDRLPSAVALAHGLQHGTGGPHLRMAIHADFGSGNVGERRIFDGGVAIAAINA